MKNSMLMTYKKAIPFVLIVAFLVSCKVTLIAPYDEVIDQKTSELHETLLLNLKTWSDTTPDYNDVIDFYNQSEATLEILIERTKDSPKSEIMAASLKNVLENIQELRAAHEGGIVDKNYIDQVYPDFNAQLGAVQRFQMALKRAGEN
jgi:hypothetical protein